MLPAWPRLIYALPAVPLAFLGLPLYVYLPAHYAALPGIGLAAVGLVLLVARLLDLLTDPMVGVLVDRLRGRLRPQWLMSLGAGLMLGGAWWLFQPGPQAGAFYLLVTLSVTYLGWTLLAVPYYALGADLGAWHGQTRIAAWREGGMIIGTLAALVLPAVLGDPTALAASAYALLWLAPPALLLVWWLRVPAAQRVAAPAASLAAMWRYTSRPARELLGIHLLNALAAGSAANLFLIYTRDVLGLDGSGSGVLLLLYFAAGLIALPFWVRYARRFGRVRAWRTAMLLAAVGFLPAVALGAGDQLAFAVVCILTGATLGADIALPAAIQGQIVVDESNHPAGPRGGTLFGLWGMASKLALALSAGLSLPLLALLARPGSGFGVAEVAPWLYAGLPVLIKLIAVVALRRSVLWSLCIEPAAVAGREDADEHSEVGRPGAAADAAHRL
ncbi:MAG: MFS transporter [Chromatiaceae bacterium]|nr:MFS transporter [Chromatiaceae bacterium]